MLTGVRDGCFESDGMFDLSDQAFWKPDESRRSRALWMYWSTPSDDYADDFDEEDTMNVQVKYYIHIRVTTTAI